MAPKFEKIFVKPAMGNGDNANRRLLVRDPVTFKPLKDEGEWKPRTVYWLRRLKCGDCEGGAQQTPETVMAAMRAPAPVQEKPQTLTIRKGED